MHDRNDSLRRVPVAKGARTPRHGPVGYGVPKQFRRLGNDCAAIVSDQLGDLAFDGLRALAFAAHHEHGLAQRRGLFLDSA